MGFFAVAAALLLAAPTHVTSIGGGAALTLPAARHMVRIDQKMKSGRLAARSAAGRCRRPLAQFLASNNEGKTWTWYAPIQDKATTAT